MECSGFSLSNPRSPRLLPMADTATATERDMTQELRDEPRSGLAAHEICMDAGSVTDVFRVVADAIDTTLTEVEVDSEAVREALVKRERQGSTAIGQGSAIPHARVEGLNESILLDVKLKKPVRWDDGEDVERCMVILVPPEAHEEHLQLTAHAVRELSES